MPVNLTDEEIMRYGGIPNTAAGKILFQQIKEAQSKPGRKYDNIDYQAAYDKRKKATPEQMAAAVKARDSAFSSFDDPNRASKFESIRAKINSSGGVDNAKKYAGLTEDDIKYYNDFENANEEYNIQNAFVKGPRKTSLLAKIAPALAISAITAGTGAALSGAYGAGTGIGLGSTGAGSTGSGGILSSAWDAISSPIVKGASTAADVIRGLGASAGSGSLDSLADGFIDAAASGIPEGASIAADGVSLLDKYGKYLGPALSIGAGLLPNKGVGGSGSGGSGYEFTDADIKKYPVDDTVSIFENFKNNPNPNAVGPYKRFFQQGMASGIDPYATYGQGPEKQFFVAPKMPVAKASGGDVAGPGNGKDDKIPAMLSDGEHVITAQEVSALGNGSSDAGHRRLYEMRKRIRAHASKNKSGHSPKSKNITEYLRGL